MKLKITLKIIFIMVITVKIFAQSSFELSGYWSPLQAESSMLNSFEVNPSNFSSVKDWGFSFEYGGEFGAATTSNIYLIAVTKRFGNQVLSARYTPGYQKEFDFLSNESIILEDSSAQSLSSKYTYKELFGFGYSYNLNSELSAGFTFRYFTQQFTQESIVPVFSDSLYLKRESSIENAKNWKGDVGINYFPFKNLSLSLATINLLNINENPVSNEYKNFELRKEKNVLTGLAYSPFKRLQVNLLYETSNSFQCGLNSSFNVFGGKAAAGITVFRDKYQSPYIAGIIPAVSYSTNLFGISLSLIKYFSNRNISHTFSKFEEQGINNIINNRFSYDKAVLTFSLTLNTIHERKIELLNVDVISEIYPTLSDDYLNKPFATAKVVNLTNKTISIKPSSKIEGINKENIQSPTVTAGPLDTVEVPFYTIIPDNYDVNKSNISYTDFYLLTNSNEPEDHSQKPILVNGVNAWDGHVSNLRYFIKKDYNFSMEYAKNILSEYKTELDTMPFVISDFYKAKIIFNKIVKRLVYASDPAASADYVQFPHETLKLKGGDCDDLSVLYSSLLESIGIHTALVDYKPGSKIGHVNVLVNTGLSPEQAILITKNDSKYIIRKNTAGVDKVWIPVEATTLTNFKSAWDQGVEKFNNDAVNNLGLAKGIVDIVDVD